MYDTIRIIHPNGHISVREYAFSQLVEMTRDFTPQQKDDFYNGKSVITLINSIYAKAGSSLKLINF